MVQLANDVLLFAEHAVSLRQDARNYRGLGKDQLADLLEQEADEDEATARKMLHRDVKVYLNGKEIPVTKSAQG